LNASPLAQAQGGFLRGCRRGQTDSRVSASGMRTATRVMSTILSSTFICAVDRGCCRETCRLGEGSRYERIIDCITRFSTRPGNHRECRRLDVVVHRRLATRECGVRPGQSPPAVGCQYTFGFHASGDGSVGGVQRAASYIAAPREKCHASGVACVGCVPPCAPRGGRRTHLHRAGAHGPPPSFVDRSNDRIHAWRPSRNDAAPTAKRFLRQE